MERTFGSINTLFCQHVASYTGRDVTRRGTDVGEPGASGRWLTCRNCWMNGLSAGSPAARGPAAPVHAGPGCSPNEVYAALVAAAGYVPVALTGEDYIELLPAQWRSIGDGGIQIDYRTYNCAELAPYRRLFVRAGRPGGPVGGPLRPLQSDPDLGAQPPPAAGGSPCRGPTWRW